MTYEDLPKWLRFIYAAIDALPIEKLRLLVGMIMAEFVVLYLEVAMWTQHKLDPTQLEYTLMFIGAMNGIVLGVSGITSAINNKQAPK